MPNVPNIHLKNSFILFCFKGIIRWFLMIIIIKTNKQLNICLENALIATVCAVAFTSAAIIENARAESTISNFALLLFETVKFNIINLSLYIYKKSPPHFKGGFDISNNVYPNVNYNLHIFKRLILDGSHLFTPNNK